MYLYYKLCPNSDQYLKKPHCCSYKYCFYSACLVSTRRLFCLLSVNVSLTFLYPLSHLSQIKLLDGEDEYYKLLSTVESIPEEEYTTSPPPALSSGLPVSQSWALQPCQPVRQTHQACRQTLQRTSSVLDVRRDVATVAAVQEKWWDETMPSAIYPKLLQSVYKTG